MITVRKSDERGHFDFGWLDTRHTFSFGQYRDLMHTSFRSLRVINEDVVAPGAGFPEHPHEEMEIITYVVQGAVAHRDTTGGEGVIRPGDVQRMSAGTGLEHSEFNASKTEPVHLLQIWIRPGKRGVTPGYDQKNFPLENRRNRLALVVSPDGRDGSLSMNQDASLYASTLAKGQLVEHKLSPGRHAWLQLIKGNLDLNGTKLAPGDGASVSDEQQLRIAAATDTEFLLFDLA